MLIGCAPFGESILMWWNILSRARPSLRGAQRLGGVRRFGAASAYAGERLAAPAFVGRA